MKKFSKLLSALMVAVLLASSVAGLASAAAPPLKSITVTHEVVWAGLYAQDYSVAFIANPSPSTATLGALDWYLTDGKGATVSIYTSYFDEPEIANAFLPGGTYKVWCESTVGRTTVKSAVHTFTLAALPDATKLNTQYNAFFDIIRKFYVNARYTYESLRALSDKFIDTQNVYAVDFDPQTGQVTVTTEELNQAAADLAAAIDGLTPRIPLLEPLYRALDKIYPALEAVYDWLYDLPIIGDILWYL
ncbi:MAG: hypothetical protein LBN05_06160 [Oscillospiraceae bacterium]|jgi:hypothetical protein|nr:hypothetical protein [Oscillospiraceae bacterium]